MFNKLQICLGPIAALIFLTSLGFSDRRQIKPPLREIDVAQKSAPYRTSLGMIVTNVQLAFLGEDRLAVMSQDDMSFPESGTARKRLHLTVDVFSLNSSDADNFSELRYETETADSRIAALPSGRMIVSLSQVCAPQPQLADKEGYVVALFPASEDVAVVSVQPTVNRLVPTEMGPATRAGSQRTIYIGSRRQSVSRTYTQLRGIFSCIRGIPEARAFHQAACRGAIALFSGWQPSSGIGSNRLARRHGCFHHIQSAKADAGFFSHRSYKYF